MQDIQSIPNCDYEVLAKMLTWIYKFYNFSLYDKDNINEAKRVHLIAPVLWAVVQLLPDIIVTVEQELNGKRIRSDGHFEFILTRGDKRVYNGGKKGAV